MTHHKEIKQWIEKDSRMIQILKLKDSDFTYYKDVKNLKENMALMSKEIGNLRYAREVQKRTKLKSRIKN